MESPAQVRCGAISPRSSVLGIRSLCVSVAGPGKACGGESSNNEHRADMRPDLSKITRRGNVFEQSLSHGFISDYPKTSWTSSLLRSDGAIVFGHTQTIQSINCERPKCGGMFRDRKDLGIILYQPGKVPDGKPQVGGIRHEII